MITILAQTSMGGLISPLTFVLFVIFLASLGLIHTLLSMRGEDDD